jgi:hypothetical protein
MVAFCGISITTAGNTRTSPNAPLQQCIRNVCNHISLKSIFNTFVKCCVTKYTNGTQNDVLWEQDHEENLSINESVDSE